MQRGATPLEARSLREVDASTAQPRGERCRKCLFPVTCRACVSLVRLFCNSFATVLQQGLRYFLLLPERASQWEARRAGRGGGERETGTGRQERDQKERSENIVDTRRRQSVSSQ